MAEPRVTARPPKQYRKLSQPEVAKALGLLADGATHAAVAAVMGVSRPAISQLAAKYQDTTLQALARLRHAADPAVQAWLTSLKPAAKQGNHKPAKDLLQAIGAISPDAAPVQVAVQVNTPGVTLPQELLQPIDNTGVSQSTSDNTSYVDWAKPDRQGGEAALEPAGDPTPAAEASGSRAPQPKIPQESR